MGKKSRKKNTKKGIKKTNPGVILGLFFIFLSTILVLFFVLKLPPNPKKNKVQKKESHIYVIKQNLKFEERLETPFEEKIKKADMAILQALIKSGLNNHNLSHVDVKKKDLKQETYLLQYLQIIGSNPKINLFKKYLKKYIYNWIQEVNLQISFQKIVIKINNIPTHIIFLTNKPLQKTFIQKKGYLILIIDDIGRDLNTAKELIKLFGPKINLSILPYTPHAKEIDNICKRHLIPTLLHMPMEPITYPETDPGPGALLTTMNSLEIKKLTLKALKNFTYIVAVNNHMGSKFTKDFNGMAAFLTELKQNNLPFIDSCTTSNSVASKIGKRLGVPIYKRDIFIDNKKDIDAILYQLKKAELYSLKKKYTIAIGHPYPETITALKIWKHIKNPHVYLTPITKIFSHNK